MYRARDTKLKREVAIKVLPERHAESPERKASFERYGSEVDSPCRQPTTKGDTWNLYTRAATQRSSRPQAESQTRLSRFPT